MADTPADDELGWWTISGRSLLGMLRRVAAGEDPDLVYVEEYANCEHDEGGDDDEGDEAGGADRAG